MVLQIKMLYKSVMYVTRCPFEQFEENIDNSSDHTVYDCVYSAGGGTAEGQGSGENNVSVTEEPRGRMCPDEGEEHQDRDAGQEREGADCICTQVHNQLMLTVINSRC